MIEEGKHRFQSETDESGLGDRESRVLHELGQEEGAMVAFQGLRRRLDLHQEILSRTLRRLERDGLVEKEDAGYRLTAEGAAALRAGMKESAAERALTVFEAVLPPHLGPEQVAAHLSRRWFRGLRWYGRSESNGGTILTWLSESAGFAVRLLVGGGRIELKVDGAGPDSSRGFAEARGILAAVAELYGLSGEPAAGVMSLAATAGIAG